MNKIRRVLLLSPQPFFVPRGTPINVREIILALSEKGYHITLMAYPFGEDIKIDNLTIVRSPKIPFIKSIKAGPSMSKIFLDILFLIKAFWVCIRSRFDIFHGIEEAGLMAGFLGLIFKKPFIVDVDSSMSQQLEESGFIKSKLILNLFEKVESFFMLRAVQVITVCTALTEDVKRICPNAKVTQIEDFPIDEENGQKAIGIDIKKLYSISKEDKLILYVGNLEIYQGIDLLINSYNLALKLDNFTSSKLIIVGGSPKDIEKYTSISNTLGLSKKIVFTGMVPPETMTSIHEQADLLVSPRISGTNTPLKIYGYMNSSKAILATKIFSHTQVLDDTSAYLAETDPKEFSTALAMAISDDQSYLEDRQNKIKTAKYLAETKYSRKRFRSHIQSLYGKILE